VTTRESQEWEELGENEKRVEDRRGGRERERTDLTERGKHSFPNVSQRDFREGGPKHGR
jgi:molybdenum-dependent DNA-binding transcriptional regulator ModE